MADLDTAAKRYSMLGLDIPFPKLFPIPDGTISQPDRQHFIGKYQGIAFSAGSTFLSRLPLLGAG